MPADWISGEFQTCSMNDEPGFDDVQWAIALAATLEDLSVAQSRFSEAYFESALHPGVNSLNWESQYPGGRFSEALGRRYHAVFFRCARTHRTQQHLAAIESRRGHYASVLGPGRGNSGKSVILRKWRSKRKRNACLLSEPCRNGGRTGGYRTE